MAGFTLGQSAREGPRCALPPPPQASSNSLRLSRAVLRKLSCGVLLAEGWRVGRRNSDECSIAQFHIATPEKSTRAGCRYRERVGAMARRADALVELGKAEFAVRRTDVRGLEPYNALLDSRRARGTFGL
jgi:hypothetical protein